MATRKAKATKATKATTATNPTTVDPSKIDPALVAAIAASLVQSGALPAEPEAAEPKTTTVPPIGPDEALIDSYYQPGARLPEGRDFQIYRAQNKRGNVYHAIYVQGEDGRIVPPSSYMNRAPMYQSVKWILENAEAYQAAITYLEAHGLEGQSDQK